MTDKVIEHTMNTATDHHPRQERQPTTVLKLSHNQPNVPSEKNHVEQTDATGRNDHLGGQAGFRSERSTTKQMTISGYYDKGTFNKQTHWCVKRYTQQDLYHVFVDVQKAFDRIRHAFMWTTLRLYNITANLITVIEQIFNKATVAVYWNGDVANRSKTTLKVTQDCLLSSTPFTTSLQRIMMTHWKVTIQKSASETEQSPTKVLPPT